MSREMVAAAVLVWLLGALVGWVTGWVARGEQNRLWHSGLQRQLAETRAQLDDALAELNTTRTHAETRRVPLPPAPTVVHVHLSPPLPWIPVQTLSGAPADAITVIPPLDEAES